MPIKTQYTVQSGDTTSLIALNYSVTVQQIIDANPQVFTPDRPLDGSLIYPGDVLNIPSGFVDELKQAQSIKVDAEDELTILIDNKKCPLPHEFSFNEYFDACSNSFSMTYPYNPDLRNPAYNINVDDFKTKGLPAMSIYIGSDIALSGSVEVPSNKITPEYTSQTLAGRSATLLLEKSDILPSIKREYLNLGLKDLCDIVANAYGISVETEGIISTEPFPKVTIEDSEKPFTFLSRIARERSCLLSSTGAGKLLLKKAVQTEPVAHFKIDSKFLKDLSFIGVQELEFTFDTREIYGQYQGKASTPDNQDLISTVQSSTILQQSMKITDYSDAEENTIDSMTEWEEQKAIREFYKNAIPYPSWINPNNGKRWKTGQFVTLEAPDAGLKAKVMLIRSITFNKDAEERRIAVLNLIPSEVYI